MTQIEKTCNFVAYWDSMGFEFIINTTKEDNQRLIDDLKGTASNSTNWRQYSLLRAKFNPQRNPQIWGFSSQMTEEELNVISKEHPQELANLIKELGWKIYSEVQKKKVIE